LPASGGSAAGGKFLNDKSAVIPANVLDFQTLGNICPENRMIFMDKLYDIKKSYSIFF